MEHCAAVCLAFPPEVPLLDDPGYDKAIKNHLSKLVKLLQDPSNPLLTHGTKLLELVDPAVNSLSYLAIIHTLLIPGVVGPREVLLEKVAVFLASFDARQVRYGGSHLLEILSLVGNGQLLPPSVAVDVLATAILRLDPSGSILTTTHTLLVKLAYTTDNIEPVLPVIDQNIVFYPGMSNHGHPQFFCDLSLSPQAYISKESGLTNALKSTAVLEYDLLVGLIYCSRRNWAKAYAAFERVITFPTRDSGTSKIMAEAYKKWILVGLLLNGKYEALPTLTGSGATKLYQTLGKPYKEVATLFETDNAEELMAEVAKQAAIWNEDQNLGLIREVLAAYQMWQVLNLQYVYSKISIAEIRQRTKSGQSGNNLSKDEDVETLIQNMIISGMLNGVIEKNDDGVTFLTFLPPSTVLSEQDFAKELARTAFRLKALQPVFKATNERLGTSKEYVKHLAKEQRRGADKIEQEFESHVDDEDLMGGITSTG